MTCSGREVVWVARTISISYTLPFLQKHNELVLNYHRRGDPFTLLSQTRVPASSQVGGRCVSNDADLLSHPPRPKKVFVLVEQLSNGGAELGVQRIYGFLTGMNNLLHYSRHHSAHQYHHLCRELQLDGQCNAAIMLQSWLLLIQSLQNC